MTGQQLFSLIQGLADVNEEMERYVSSDQFRLTNTYLFYGYEVEKIAKLCREAEQFICSMEVKSK